MSAALTVVVSSLLALAGAAALGRACPAEQFEPPKQTMRCGVGAQDHIAHDEACREQRAVVEVVFVLDTTGSMGGLIDGAKQKIWSIATRIDQSQSAPIVRMGLVGYRDRGDDYVTRVTELTDDLDTVYTDLMGYQARGGGDTPESVNEALFDAVNRIEWSDDENALRLIYLVGDAPPQMNYEDDVKYLASCKLARERGIYINAIQCGSIEGTRAVWQEIAQNASGMYATIEHSGGVVPIATPYDQEIARLDTDLRATMIDYGNRETLGYQFAKRENADLIAESASPEAAADRAVYNQTAAGRANYIGRQELVDDYANDRVELSEIENGHLPEPLQGLSEDELKAEVEKRLSQRQELTARMNELAAKRAEHIRANTETNADGFDRRVVEALLSQGARRGVDLSLETPASADEQAD